MRIHGEITSLTMGRIEGKMVFDQLSSENLVDFQILPRFLSDQIGFSVNIERRMATSDRQIWFFEIVVNTMPEGWGWREFHAALEGVDYRLSRWSEGGVKRIGFGPTALARVNPGTSRPRGEGEDRRVAVLIRTHLSDSKVGLDLAEQMSRVGGWDVYFSADETRGPVETGRFPKLAHSHASCEELGVSFPKSFTLHHFGDYALYASYEQIPDYDFYFMIEHDVSLFDARSDYFQRLSDALRTGPYSHLDYVGTLLHLHSTKRPVVERLLRGEEEGDAEMRPYVKEWKAILPFVGVSRRAIPTLIERRMLEQRLFPDKAGMNVESFIPTVLMDTGAYNLAGINALIPGSVHAASFNTREGRPFGHVAARPSKGMIVHPVTEIPAFLSRSWKEASKSLNPVPMMDWMNYLEERGCATPDFPSFKEKLERLTARDGAAEGVHEARA